MLEFPRHIVAARFLVTAGRPPMANAGILLCAGRIAAVAPLTELKRSYPGIDITEYPDGILVPLLVNAHTHLELTDFPLWARAKERHHENPAHFVDWILSLIAVKRKLDPGCYRLALQNGIDQSIKAGTGVVGDILAHHSARSAYLGTTLAGVVFLETLGQDPATIQRLKKGLNETLKESFTARPTIGLSPHSPYTISGRYLRYVYDVCRRRGLRCCTHLAESAEEITFLDTTRGDLAERFYPAVNWEGFLPAPAGLRPVAYLEQQGGLFPDNLLVHGVHLNNAEIALLARKGMSLVLCPRSNAGLNVGKAPAAQLSRAGVRLALGTDSLASSDSLSVWDEMAFAARWFDGELDPPTLFAMATQQGADVLGLGSMFGSLSCDKQASFQVVTAPPEVSDTELYEYFVSGIRQSDIIQIYADGQPLLSGYGLSDG